MMIMEGSNMSKTEYDLKAICILPMTHPINCAIYVEIRLSGNPEYHPIMQADTCYMVNWLWPADAIWIDILVNIGSGNGV